MRTQTKKVLQVLALMFAVCAASLCIAVETDGTPVSPAPVKPYQRVYILVNFAAEHVWIGMPLADSLNHTLTANGKIVRSELQLVDDLALAPGPNMIRAHEFKPDGTLICHLTSLQRIVNGGFGGSGQIACDLYDASSGARVWRGKNEFTISGADMKTIMGHIATKIVQDLSSVKLI